MPATPALTPRKAPRQRRAQETVEAILTATARVLVEDGFDRASTNRIARVAGVSVGSLYQYFPSKEALAMALVERHTSEMLGLLGGMAAQLADAPIPVAVRTFVRAMVQAHALDPALHRVLVGQVLHVGSHWVAEVECQAQAIVRAYLEHKRAQIAPQDLETAAFVLVTTVEAVTHRAVIDRPELLESSALEDEICNLVLRYLGV
jgi:AcrR family transcriptional regulator